MSGSVCHIVHVLLVADSSATGAGIRVLLASCADAEFAVEEVPSVGAALRRLAANELDIVLLDSQVADGGDLEGLRTLRTRFPHKPIILLIQFERRGLAPQALTLGAKDCIVSDRIDGNLLGRIILR